MQLIDHSEILEAVARAHNKWCTLIRINENDPPWEELYGAAPYLERFEATTLVQMFVDGCGILVFDSEEECRAAFAATVGDDGPTETNSYNGPIRVYALTCCPTRGLMSENT